MALNRDHYGYRNFALDRLTCFRLTRWLYALCWAGDDRPSLFLGRYAVLQLAEVAVPRALFAAILRQIERPRGPPVAVA